MMTAIKPTAAVRLKSFFRRRRDETRREQAPGWFRPPSWLQLPGTSPGNSRKLSKLLRNVGTSWSNRFDSTVYLTS